MRRSFTFLAALALFAASAQPAPAADPLAIAQRLEESMGGAAFATARVLHFTWAVERGSEQVVAYDHTWDRWTGNYRLSGIDRETGQPWLALFNINSREGRVWLGTETVADDALAGHLERAYGRFINDTYWLLMPWKWQDPGVTLTYVGHEGTLGSVADVVELTFGAVGLTSKDRYRGYIDRDTGRMVQWSYILQDEEGNAGTGEATQWAWNDWVEVPPGAWFSERKQRVGGEGPAVAITTAGIELHVEPSAEQLAEWFGSE